MTEKETKIYFPGLNVIRFWAAISVVFDHIEEIKGWFGINVPGESRAGEFFLN